MTAESRAPETGSQAVSWQRVFNHAAGAGLCHGCAAQVAWGAQGGFASVRPPCGSCAALVRSWPSPKLCGWRVPTGALSATRTWESLRLHSDRLTPREVVGKAAGPPGEEKRPTRKDGAPLEDSDDESRIVADSSTSARHSTASAIGGAR